MLDLCCRKKKEKEKIATFVKVELKYQTGKGK